MDISVNTNKVKNSKDEEPLATYNSNIKLSRFRAVLNYLSAVKLSSKICTRRTNVRAWKMLRKSIGMKCMII